MNIRSRKTLLLYSAMAALLGILTAVVRIIITSGDAFEPGIELYVTGAPAPTVLHIFMVLCVALAVTSAFTVAGKPSLYPDAKPSLGAPTQLNVFTSALCGFLLLAYDILTVYRMSQNNWRAIGPLIGRAPTADVPLASSVFLLLMVVSAVPAAIYFLRIAFGSSAQTTAFGIFSAMPALWLILLVLNSYFDSTLSLNSPIKILRMLAIASMMLYAVQESRLAIGIPLPKVFFPYALFTVYLCIAHALSDAVLLAKNVIVVRDGFLLIAFELAYGLYVLSRLLRLCVRARGTKPAAVVPTAVAEAGEQA